jgi:hypothetical protein
MSTFDAHNVKVFLILCYFVLEIHHHVASYIDKVEHSLCVEFSQVQVLGYADCQIPKEGLCHYLFNVFGSFLESIMDLFPRMEFHNGDGDGWKCLAKKNQAMDGGCPF